MRIAFFSTLLHHSWGGSEELWSRTAAALLDRGHYVAFSTSCYGKTAAQLQQLVAAGAQPCFRRKFRMGRSLRRALERMRLAQVRFGAWLLKAKPDLVVISLSWHLDDPLIADTCQKLGIPYVLVLQAASAAHWVNPKNLPKLRAAYEHARQVYFVSPENRETMEANLGLDLSRAEIVDNPFAVGASAAPSWPASEPFWKLAMVGRIHFGSKSQDLVLRALRAPKWRDRPLKIVCWGGDDGNLDQLGHLIEVFGLQHQVSYGGFATDIESLWANHHGLLLPSRLEGNALALIEAMMCGRVPIVTNVGRATELIDDGESGFIAPAATVELIDQVLERAWQRRNDWRDMGQRAARAIRQRHSIRPAEDFADRLLALAGERKVARAKAA
jgi:glycosyltransferase involved in cell wall biosynthesis